MQQRKLQREQNQQKEKIDFEMKKQNQINDTTKSSESKEIIKDIADFETVLEINRNDRNSLEVSILRVAALWSGMLPRQIIYWSCNATNGRRRSATSTTDR